MDSTTWLNSLPENPILKDSSNKYEEMILDAVSSGLATVSWLPVTSTIPGHTAVFQVCDDAMRVVLEDGSRFRFSVTANMTQKCADLVGGSMMTSKIMDLSYQQAALAVDCCILPAGPLMSTIDYSKRWNAKVEAKRNGETGLFRDAGKAWILDNRLAISAGAINYGFYAHDAPYFNARHMQMYQTEGTKHNSGHVDYSQSLYLMEAICKVDGQDMMVTDIMKDKELSKLINYDGILNYTRQPGV